jgi:uncharacterized protein (DUF58 family)
MIKEFIPERDRSIVLAVDCSASMAYSSKASLKKDVALTIAAALSFIAGVSHDKVGILAFSDKIHARLPPQRGKLVLTKILDTLCLAMVQGGKTNFAEALRFLTSNKLSKSILFFISDWVCLDNCFNRELKLIARRLYKIFLVKTSIANLPKNARKNKKPPSCTLDNKGDKI